MCNPRKPIPKEARKNRAIKIAREFIVGSGINWLPVDPFILFEKYGWLLFTRDNAKTILKESDPLLLKKTGAEARTSLERDGTLYITVYNDMQTPHSRVRWTLTHEIGHIVLGHLTTFANTSLTHGGLTLKEYEVLEDEANFFAAELLQPMPVLIAAGISKKEHIERACFVSKKASLNREKDISWWGKTYPAYIHKRHILFQFSLYLTSVTVCMKKERVLKFQNNCYKYPETKNMSDSLFYVKTDDNYRFLECPRCGNDVFSEKATYCRLCGLYLYNSCGGIENTLTTSHHCGEINPGDARYCEFCGQETTLTKLGLIKTWEEIQESGIEVAASMAVSVDDAFPEDDTFPDINDEDVPF